MKKIKWSRWEKSDEEKAAGSSYLHTIITESDLLGARPDSSTSIVPFGPYAANAIHTHTCILHLYVCVCVGTRVSI